MKSKIYRSAFVQHTGQEPDVNKNQPAVLVVDDEAAIRDMMRFALKQTGMNVQSAANAHGGFNCTAAIPYPVPMDISRNMHCAKAISRTQSMNNPAPLPLYSRSVHP